MAQRLSRRFFEIASQDGWFTALRSAGRFASSQFDSVVDGLRLRLLRMQTDGSTVVRDVNGSEMELDVRPSSPHSIEKTLALDGVREPASTETFRRVLTTLTERYDGQVHVFDVGANVGYFALLEANVLGERGSIYAVEAAPENAARLEQNVERNDYSQVEVRQIAAGAERSTMELTIREESNVHRMSDVIDDASAVDTVDVDVRTLDGLVEEHGIPDGEPVVVRMDAEGYEGHIFDGMADLLSGDRPVYLFVELHPAVDAVDVDDICDSLQRNGFELEYVSFDGGDTISRAASFDDVRGTTANTHVMASRL